MTNKVWILFSQSFTINDAYFVTLYAQINIYKFFPSYLIRQVSLYMHHKSWINFQSNKKDCIIYFHPIKFRQLLPKPFSLWVFHFSLVFTLFSLQKNFNEMLQPSVVIFLHTQKVISRLKCFLIYSLTFHINDFNTSQYYSAFQ